MEAFRALAAATACALGAAAAVPALPAGERRLYAFPHRPHLSPPVVAAALEAAAKPVLWKPGAAPAATKDAECIVCHDYSKGDDAEPHLDSGLRVRGCRSASQPASRHLCRRGSCGPCLPDVRSGNPLYH